MGETKHNMIPLRFQKNRDRIAQTLSQLHSPSQTVDGDQTARLLPLPPEQHLQSQRIQDAAGMIVRPVKTSQFYGSRGCNIDLSKTHCNFIHVYPPCLNDLFLR